jgi:hypothetical protein
MFISVMLVGPSARVETLISTGPICEKIKCVDFTKKNYQHVFISFKTDKKQHISRGNKLVWLQTVRLLPLLSSLLA